MSSLDQEVSARPQDDAEEDMIEHLRCHYCKGYLSCSPLRVLSNGHSICGRCEPSDNDVSVCRILDMENALAKVTFPCRFQENGCSKRMLFGHIFDHERVCEYQPFTCFAAALGSCSWEGRLSDIYKHFSENHQECNWVGEQQHFRIVVEEDCKRDFLVFEKQDVLTLIKYSYNSAKKILEYCIEYMPLDSSSLNVFYVIELHNIASRTPCITIKNVPYLYQQTHARRAPNKLSKIMLEPYVDILESPDIIVFSVIMFEERLPCSEMNKKTWEEMMFERVTTPAVNYDLKSLRCVLCGIYVTPPLFKDSEGELVCTDCGQKHENCSSYEDEKLETLMGEVNYPCRWGKCNVTRKVDSIRQHEKNCQYRTFNCVVVDCNKIYKRGQVLDHFEKHHCDYSHIKDGFAFVVSSYYGSEKKLFVVKDDEAIVIEFIYNKNNQRFVFKVIPLSASPDISAYVQHKAKECMWRSMDFCLPNDFKIDSCSYPRGQYYSEVIFSIK